MTSPYLLHPPRSLEQATDDWWNRRGKCGRCGELYLLAYVPSGFGHFNWCQACIKETGE